MALVRPTAAALAPSVHRVLLIGGTVARSLAPALGRLATDSGVGLRVYTTAPGAPESAALDPATLKARVKEYRPSLVLFGLQRPEQGALESEAIVRRHGAALLWLALKGRGPSTLSAETLHLLPGGGRMQPSAAGYAAWAAVVWRMLG